MNKYAVFALAVIFALLASSCGTAVPSSGVCGGVTYKSEDVWPKFESCKDGKTAVFVDGEGNKIYAEFSASPDRLTQGQTLTLTAEAWARSKSGSIPYVYTCYTTIGNDYYYKFVDTKGDAGHDKSYIKVEYTPENDTVYKLECATNAGPVAIYTNFLIPVFPAD